VEEEKRAAEEGMTVRSMFGGSWVAIFFCGYSFSRLGVCSWGLEFGGWVWCFGFAKVEVAIGAAREDYVVGCAIGSGSFAKEVPQSVAVAAEVSSVAIISREVDDARLFNCC
jgi:hypothetical protein